MNLTEIRRQYSAWGIAALAAEVVSDRLCDFNGWFDRHIVGRLWDMDNRR